MGNLPTSGPPSADSILINGTKKSPGGEGSSESYRLRLANSGADNALRILLDNHSFQVMIAAFVLVRPFNVASLLLKFDTSHVLSKIVSENHS